MMIGNWCYESHIKKKPLQSNVTPNTTEAVDASDTLLAGTLPSHCLLGAVIVYKPTLGQTWPQASLWPQCAFKMSMFKAVCDSH